MIILSYHPTLIGKQIFFLSNVPDLSLFLFNFPSKDKYLLVFFYCAMDNTDAIPISTTHTHLRSRATGMGGAELPH